MMGRQDKSIAERRKKVKARTEKKGLGKARWGMGM